MIKSPYYIYLFIFLFNFPENFNKLVSKSILLMFSINIKMTTLYFLNNLLQSLYIPP